MMSVPNSAFKKEDLRYILIDNLLPALKSSQHQIKAPSNAAIRNAKQWAIAANLIDDRGLTQEGSIVITRDPYLETTVTDWSIHFNLSSHDRSLWKYFVYDFLPEYPTFAKYELLNCAIDKFTAELPERLKKNVGSILKLYTESQAISKNQFLTLDRKSYSIGTPDLSNPYTTGYLLAKIWEREFNDRAVVSVDRIIDIEMRLTDLLGIDSERLRQQLDILAELEIVEQRSNQPHLPGTKPPRKQDDERSYQVYRCWNTPSELLEKAYDNDIATPNRPLIQSLADILDDGDESPDFSQLFTWAVSFVVIKGGMNVMDRLAS
jgi:hypothetical protein